MTNTTKITGNPFASCTRDELESLLLDITDLTERAEWKGYRINPKDILELVHLATQS